MSMPFHRVWAALAAMVTAVTLASCASTGAHRPPVRVTGPSSAAGPAAPANVASGQRPLPGPDVLAAQLFAGGRGYLRTTDSLLWTDDFGATWRAITQPGQALTQPRSWWNTAAILPDGHMWFALTPAAGATSITVLRADSPGGRWRRSQIPLGALTVRGSGYGAAGASLSFVSPRDGWLLVSWSDTGESWGELLATTDGGATWTLRAGRAQLPREVGPIHFLTPTVGVMDLDGSMFQLGWWITHDAGRHWTRLHLPVPATDEADTMRMLAAPTLAGGAIVAAAQFSTPVQGNAAGLGIFRSTDGGRSWTVQPVTTPAGPAQYAFAATPDGSAYLLLHSRSGPGMRPITWVSARSTDAGRSFADTSSVHDAWPGQLTAADVDHLWTIASTSGCTGFKTGCWSTSALFASADGGTTWRQVDAVEPAGSG